MPGGAERARVTCAFMGEVLGPGRMLLVSELFGDSGRYSTSGRLLAGLAVVHVNSLAAVQDELEQRPNWTSVTTVVSLVRYLTPGATVDHNHYS